MSTILLDLRDIDVFMDQITKIHLKYQLMNVYPVTSSKSLDANLDLSLANDVLDMILFYVTELTETLVEDDDLDEMFDIFKDTFMREINSAVLEYVDRNDVSADDYIDVFSKTEEYINNLSVAVTTLALKAFNVLFNTVVTYSVDLTGYSGLEALRHVRSITVSAEDSLRQLDPKLILLDIRI